MNPITQMLNGTKSNNMLSGLSIVRGMMGNNPDAMFNQMMQNNPQFRDFVSKNKGKSVEQIASEYGVNMDQLRQILR